MMGQNQKKLEYETKISTDSIEGFFKINTNHSPFKIIPFWRGFKIFSEERAWRKERKRGYTFARFLFTATPRHKRLARKKNSKDWTTDWTCIFFKRNF